MCGDLEKHTYVNKVTVMGWVQRKRNLGGLSIYRFKR